MYWTDHPIITGISIFYVVCIIALCYFVEHETEDRED